NKETSHNSPSLKEREPEGEAFYIGWMPNAPNKFSKHIKKVVVFLALLVVTVSIVLALSQKKFSTGTFEFGTLTTVKGIFSRTPVPNIKVINGRSEEHTSEL